MKRKKLVVRQPEREALHIQLDHILSGGDSAEIALVYCLLAELRPVPCCKACAAKLEKMKGQLERLP